MIHYLYRDDLLKLKNLSDEAKFLVLNNVSTLGGLATDAERPGKENFRTLH